MIKSGLISAIQSKIAVPKETVESVINTAIYEITEALKNEGEVTLRGLGNFTVKQKSERPGRNPKTGEDAIISARKVVIFKASTTLKEAINS